MRSRNSADGIAGSAPSAPARPGDLRIRVLSALVLAPVVLAAAYLGGLTFHGLILVFVVLAAREWLALVEPGCLPLGWCAVAMVAAVPAAGMVWPAGPVLLLAAALTLALAVLAPFLGARRRLTIAFAVPYLGATSYALSWLRDRPGAGLALLSYVLLVVWATDIGAYAAGRSLGGPKLAPRFSPKKTWAGLIGGMAAAAAVGWAVARGFGAVPDAQAWLAAVLGALLAVVGQAGDLFESAVKRRCNVKDSGHLIPGHGGLLDRVDGLIAVAPVFAILYASIQAISGAKASWW